MARHPYETTSSTASSETVTRNQGATTGADASSGAAMSAKRGASTESRKPREVTKGPKPQPKEAQLGRLTPALLRRAAAAEFLSVSPGTFDLMVREGAMPRPRIFASLKFWSVRDLDRAVDALPFDGDDEAETTTWDDV